MVQAAVLRLREGSAIANPLFRLRRGTAVSVSRASYEPRAASLKPEPRSLESRASPPDWTDDTPSLYRLKLEPRACSLNKNQPHPYAHRDCLGSRGSSGLCEDGADVELHGMIRYPKTRRDFLVSQSFCHHAQHFDFARCEFLKRFQCRVGGATLAIAGKQIFGDFRIQKNHSVTGRLDGRVNFFARSFSCQKCSHVCTKGA